MPRRNRGSKSGGNAPRRNRGNPTSNSQKQRVQIDGVVTLVPTNGGGGNQKRGETSMARMKRYQAISPAFAAANFGFAPMAGPSAPSRNQNATPARNMTPAQRARKIKFIERTRSKYGKLVPYLEKEYLRLTQPDSLAQVGSDVTSGVIADDVAKTVATDAAEAVISSV
jgi:hypothetical protein